MSVFHPFRRLVVALEDLQRGVWAVVKALVELLDLQAKMGPALTRLESLELSRAQFEAEMGALVLKAEGKFKAANNAEARERQLKKSYEQLAAELDFEGVQPETPAGDPVLADDAPGSDAERLHSMRLDVAPSPKALALRHKFGA